MKLLFIIFDNKIIVKMDELNWEHPITITGPPAEGKRYLQRQHINDDFWREIDKGCHILFIAPRRVGKTSIMKDIAVSGKKGYVCRIVNIESEKNQQQLFRKLFQLICNELNTYKKSK